MSTLRPLYISKLGLDDTHSKVLHVAVEMLVQEGIACAFLSDTDLRGDLIVVDVTNAVGKNTFSQLRPGQVKLVFSSEPISGKNTISLTKPVRVTTLKDLLQDICLKMLKHLNSKAISNPGPRVHAKTQEMNLFLLLLDVKRKQKLIKISYRNFPDVYINGLNNTLMCTEHSVINDLISIPIENLTITTLKSNQFDYDSVDLNINTLDRTIWKAGIVCSNGRILPGQDLNKPVKLKAWPNFTRNSFKPEYFKLAAILARQAVSLNSLKRITNVPMEDIVNFYNAAYGVGLIVDADIGEIVEKKSSNPANPFRRKLISMLSRRLGFG